MYVQAPSREKLATWFYCLSKSEGDMCVGEMSPGTDRLLGGFQPVPRRSSSWNSMQSDSFHGESGRWALLPDLSVLSLGVYRKCSHAYLKLLLCIPWSCGTCECHVWSAFRDRWFKNLSQCGSYKSRGTRCGSKPFSLHGEAGSWGSSPDCKALCQGWALWQECISTFPAHFVVLTSQCVVVTHLVSAFLLGGINPCLAVCLLHPWEEGKLGASYLPFLVMTTMWRPQCDILKGSLGCSDIPLAWASPLESCHTHLVLNWLWGETSRMKSNYIYPNYPKN